jgi:hypothetical protein
MKLVPYSGPTVLKWPVDVIVIWRFSLGACELIHMFVLKEKKTAGIMLKIIGASVRHLVARVARPPASRNKRHHLDALFSLLRSLWSKILSVFRCYSSSASSRNLRGFVGAFAKLRKATINFVMSVCRSVCAHGTSRRSLDGFSWNLIFEYFLKICGENSRLIKIWQE